MSTDESNPSHYDGDRCMRKIAELGLAREFCLGNVLKYLWRLDRKASTDVHTDINKVLWYIEWYEKHGPEYGAVLAEDVSILRELRLICLRAHRHVETGHRFDARPLIEELSFRERK